MGVIPPIALCLSARTLYLRPGNDPWTRIPLFGILEQVNHHPRTHVAPECRLKSVTSTAPPNPAGTMAAPELMWPSSEVRVVTWGWALPLGQTVRLANVFAGATATLKE